MCGTSIKGSGRGRTETDAQRLVLVAWARKSENDSGNVKACGKEVRSGCWMFLPFWHWHLRTWLGSWLFSGVVVVIFEAGARLSVSILCSLFTFWWVPRCVKSTSFPGTVIKPHTCIQNGVKKREREREKKRAIDLYDSVISLGTRWAFTLGWLRKRPCLWLDLSGSGCVTLGTWGNKTTGNCQCLHAQRAVCCAVQWWASLYVCTQGPVG